MTRYAPGQIGPRKTSIYIKMAAVPAIVLATALRDKLLDPDVYGHFDLYFSDSGIQQLGWLSMYRPAQPCPRLLDRPREGITELRIHTNSVASELGGTDGFIHGECNDNRAWRDGDKGIRSEFLGISDTEWGVGPMGFNGQQWMLMKDNMNRMNAQRVQAIPLIESTRLKRNLDRYLTLSVQNIHAGIGYNFTPLRRVVEVFDDLTHLDAGDHITTQPLALDWVLRKIPGGSYTAGALTHVDCQYWIDISPIPPGGPPAAMVIEHPNLEDVTDLVRGLIVLKLHIGAMEYVPGFSNGYITNGEGYRVAHRRTLTAAMTVAHLLAPNRFYIVQIIRFALANLTLRVLELTGTRATPNFEDFYSPVGAGYLPMMPNGLSVLRLENLTINNLQAFRVILHTLQSLTRVHLVNLQGGVVNVGVVPPFHWEDVLGIFEHVAIGPPIPLFPGLRELNVKGLKEEIRVPNPHVGQDPFSQFYSPWDSAAVQTVGYIPALGTHIPEPFVSGDPVHARIQARFAGITGGMIAEVAEVQYTPGLQGPAGNIIPSIMEQPAKPRRPRYWFH